MKAAVFYDPGKMETRDDVAEPRAAPGEVLLEVAACGICGSDMHLFRTNAHRAGGVLITNEQGFEIPGHEYSGVIVEMGEGVSGFEVGQRVVGVTGGGAFAERVRVPVNPYQIAPIPDGVSFEAAATTEPMADALQIVRLGDIQPGEQVVVFGVGIIGLGVVQALKAKAEAGRIVAIDVSDTRLAKARELGADEVVNAREVSSVVDAVGAICGWSSGMFGVRGTNVAAVLDCAGYLKHMTGPPPLQSALDMLAPRGGRVVCFGAYEGALTVKLDDLITKQVRIIGSLGYSPEDLKEALRLMASGAVERDPLVTHRFPLDRIVEAFETQGGPDAIKVMVHPR